MCVCAVDKNGDVVLHAQYDEWGASLTATRLTPNYSGLDNANNFTGYTWDDTLQIYYAQARFYDPTTHRFTQQDPVKDGENWYAYIENNPLNFTDPWGLQAGDLYINNVLITHRTTINGVQYGSLRDVARAFGVAVVNIFEGTLTERRVRTTKYKVEIGAEHFIIDIALPVTGEAKANLYKYTYDITPFVGGMYYHPYDKIKYSLVADQANEGASKIVIDIQAFINWAMKKGRNTPEIKYDLGEIGGTWKTSNTSSFRTGVEKVVFVQGKNARKYYEDSLSVSDFIGKGGAIDDVLAGTIAEGLKRAYYNQFFCEDKLFYGFTDTREIEIDDTFSEYGIMPFFSIETNTYIYEYDTAFYYVIGSDIGIFTPGAF